MSPVALAALPPAAEPSLVDIIDFKWLMAAEGHRVHVERLQADRAYALDCIALAACSPTDALRQVARRLRTWLA